MVTAVTLAVSACNIGGESSNALDEVAERTRAAGSAQITRTLQIARLGAYETHGVVDFSTRRGRFTLEAFRLTEVVDGDASYVRFRGEPKWIETSGWNRKSLLQYGDPSTWLDGLENAERVEELGAGHHRGRVDGVRFEVWIDGGGRARTISFRDHTGATVALRYRRFGVPVRVQVPGRSETITSEEHQGQLRRAIRLACEGRDPTSLAACTVFPEDERD